MKEKNNMEKFIEELNKAKRNVALSRESKDAIRERLVSYMRAREAVSDKATPASLTGQGAWGISFRPITAFASVMLVLVAGVGTSSASEKSLPGDILYPVKLLTEEVRGSLAVSAESKADWEAHRADRRMEEAVTLAAQGKLTPEAKVDLEEKFAAHSENVQANIVALETKEDFTAAAGAASRFEASLKAHNVILNRVAEKIPEAEKEKVAALQLGVKNNLREVKNARESSEVKAEVKGDVKKDKAEAEREFKEAQLALENARAFIAAEKARLGESVIEAEANAMAVEAIVTNAGEALRDGAYKDAVKLSHKAVRAAKEVRAFAKAKADLDIDSKITRPKNGGGFGGAAATMMAPPEANSRALKSAPINQEAAPMQMSLDTVLFSDDAPEEDEELDF